MSVFMRIRTGLGIGSATAERFAKEGFHIVLSGRNTERLHIMAENFKAKNIHIATVTIAALVEANSETSKKIADIFWKHHASKKENLVPDILYRE